MRQKLIDFATNAEAVIISLVFLLFVAIPFIIVAVNFPPLIPFIAIAYALTVGAVLAFVVGVLC